jgi:hypothetical protein
VDKEEFSEGERYRYRPTQEDGMSNKVERSARKAQLAVREYKRRGGGYCGRKPKETSLAQWTEEEWGTKSGRKSLGSGEWYLPKRAREALSDEEYRATSDKKRRDLERGRQHSRQPKRIAEKTARYRDGGTEPTKSDLYNEARRRDLPGRSRMSKAELARALKR